MKVFLAFVLTLFSVSQGFSQLTDEQKEYLEAKARKLPCRYDYAQEFLGDYDAGIKSHTIVDKNYGRFLGIVQRISRLQFDKISDSEYKLLKTEATRFLQEQGIESKKNRLLDLNGSLQEQAKNSGAPEKTRELQAKAYQILQTSKSEDDIQRQLKPYIDSYEQTYGRASFDGKKNPEVAVEYFFMKKYFMGLQQIAARRALDVKNDFDLQRTLRATEYKDCEEAPKDEGLQAKCNFLRATFQTASKKQLTSPRHFFGGDADIMNFEINSAEDKYIDTLKNAFPKFKDSLEQKEDLTNNLPILERMEEALTSFQVCADKMPALLPKKAPPKTKVPAPAQPAADSVQIVPKSGP